MPNVGTLLIKTDIPDLEVMFSRLHALALMIVASLGRTLSIMVGCPQSVTREKRLAKAEQEITINRGAVEGGK
jgi:hypothetical protein